MISSVIPTPEIPTSRSILFITLSSIFIAVDLVMNSRIGVPYTKNSGVIFVGVIWSSPSGSPYVCNCCKVG